jgi:hypothetical protein
MVKAAGTRIERVPAEYRTESETIETSPASTQWIKKKADRNCLSADPNDCLVWCLVEIPASYQTVTSRIRVGCPTGYTDNGDDCTREVDIPADYETRTYRTLMKPATTTVVEIPAEYTTRTFQKLVSPATTRVEEIPAEYTTRSWKKLVSPATTRVEEIPAEYTTRSFKVLKTPATTRVEEVPAEYTTRTIRKLVKPATTTVVEIPAEYSTRSYRKLVSPAGVRTIDIPAEYTTVTKRRLVQKGGFTEWREVVCDSDITADLVRRVQAALRSAGYDPGPVDNILGSQTKAALKKYQMDKGLPVGDINIETMEALGLKY